MIGASFGAAIYFLVAGSLMPIAVPAEAAKLPYFYAGLAFIAGFSERWAQDMLVKTGERIKTIATKKDQLQPQGKKT